jgi:small subunit ribosomal protein S20
MANTKSAKKRVRQTARRTTRNRDAMSQIRTALKKAYTTVQDNAKEAEETVVNAIRKLMKASGKGVMHKNTISRHVSRLSAAHSAALKNAGSTVATAATTKKVAAPKKKAATKKKASSKKKATSKKTTKKKK